MARDIPGILDIIFPRLGGALVASMNRKMVRFACAEPLDEDLVAQTAVQKSMLFEVAVVLAEQKLGGAQSPDFAECLDQAYQRQRKHYDARPPEALSESDLQIIRRVADNLVSMLQDFAHRRQIDQIAIRPSVSGFGWIGSGVGDFAIGDVLVEVKNTDRNFISSDYRQILLYWMLAYAKGLETSEAVWDKFLLINPRLNRSVYGSFDPLSQAASGGLNRLEVYEYLRSIIASPTDTQK